MKTAVSPYYFAIFLLLYVTTNICYIQTVTCSTEFNGFTPKNTEGIYGNSFEKESTWDRSQVL